MVADRGLGVCSAAGTSAYILLIISARWARLSSVCEAGSIRQRLAEARRVVDQADQAAGHVRQAPPWWRSLEPQDQASRASSQCPVRELLWRPVGVRRPTTSARHGVSWGEESAEDLLDWLQIPADGMRWPVIRSMAAALDGVWCLLDPS